MARRALIDPSVSLRVCGLIKLSDDSPRLKNCLVMVVAWRPPSVERVRLGLNRARLG
jgi:hypothetical protein